jgi:hypothetical protein
MSNCECVKCASCSKSNEKHLSFYEGPVTIDAKVNVKDDVYYDDDDFKLQTKIVKIIITMYLTGNEKNVLASLEFNLNTARNYEDVTSSRKLVEQTVELKSLYIDNYNFVPYGKNYEISAIRGNKICVFIPFHTLKNVFNCMLHEMRST